MKEIKLEKEELDVLINYLGDGIKEKKLADKLSRIRDKKPISVSSRKAKGRELQYKVCEMISQTIEIPYDQHDPNSLIHSNEMGQAGTDIILRHEAREAFPFSIECKAQENLSMADWINQARANEEKDMHWMLVFKKHTMGTKPIVCMDLEVFLDFWKQFRMVKNIWRKSQ